MSMEPPAKFFVNSGLVSSPVDIYHVLRPLLKQTVTYRYLRSGRVISHGIGWVERIVPDRADVSSFFTPLSICLSVASWEHLEFETRPDQLLNYVLVQGDERVVLEFMPTSPQDQPAVVQQSLHLDGGPDYVQMELAAFGLSADPEAAADAQETPDAGREQAEEPVTGLAGEPSGEPGDDPSEQAADDDRIGETDGQA
jgi:hypothetical protein